MDKPQVDPALIQSDDQQPSLGSAPPSSSLSASQRIREIREIGWPCLCAPALECFDRRDPSNQPIAAVEWCDNCTVAWLLQRSDQDAETIAKLTRIVELKTAHLEKLLPCPDCRDKVKSGDCQRCRAQRAEDALAAARQEVAELTAWRPMESARTHDGPLLVSFPARRAISASVEMVAGWHEYEELLDFGEPPADGWLPLPLAAARLRATRQRTTNEKNDELATRIGETSSAPSPQHAATDTAKE